MGAPAHATPTVGAVTVAGPKTFRKVIVPDSKPVVNKVEEVAVNFLRRGWAVLPIAPGDKIPHTDLLPFDWVANEHRWSLLRERPAPEPVVRSWFNKCPDINIGIICGVVSGGLVVVDVDKPELAKHLHLPPTAQVLTSRGAHYYYRSSEPVKTRMTPWGEIRGEGAYVVAPASTHQSGHVYEWADWCDPDTTEIAPLPSSILLEPVGMAQKKPREKVLKNKYISTRVPEACTVEAPLPMAVESSGIVAASDLNAWVKREDVALAIAGLCGVRNPRINKAFRCVLPGHEESKPSVALYRMDDDTYMYHDFHCADGDEWYTLAEVYAAVRSKKVRKLGPGEKATWLIRGLLEAGFVKAPTIFAPVLPDSAKPIVKAVYEGFRLLLAVRMVYDSKQPKMAPYAHRFASAWTGRSERHCREAIRWLLENGYLHMAVERGETTPQGARLKQGLIAFGSRTMKGDANHE